MKRHVIVEGPDGSGKDTLIQELLVALPNYVLHERASTSIGGPVKNLAEWVSNDVNTMEDQPRSIYNRHPLVSEKIYARYRQPPGHREVEWQYPTWVDAMKNYASNHCVLVMCQPPLAIVEAVIRTQGADAHMPGVAENIRQIYADYVTYFWPGYVIYYDWTQGNVRDLVAHIEKAIP